MSDSDPMFILSAYRPGGADADDPDMKRAIAAMENDPDRRAEFERQREFDAAVAEGLAEFPCPDDLRETILTGAKFARPFAKRKRRAALMRSVITAGIGAAAAAAVALALIPDKPAQPAPDIASQRADASPSDDPGAPWRSHALSVLNAVMDGGERFDVAAPDPDTVHAWLVEHSCTSAPVPDRLVALPAVGCKFQSDPENGCIALVCFDAGDNVTLHLSVVRCGGQTDPVPPPRSSEPPLFRDGRWVSAVWASPDGSWRCVLSADAADPAARRRLLDFAPARMVSTA